MKPIPATWPELREAEQSLLEDHLDELRSEADSAAEVLDEEVPALTSAFNESADYLARVFITGGAEVARASCYLADRALPRLLDHGEAPAVRAPASAMSALSYLALMRCLGVSPPKEAADVDVRWLNAVAAKPERLGDAGRRTAALASVACGEVDLVPQFVGGGPLVARKTSRVIAGPNIAGFTRHLAEVVKGGGTAQAVEDSWHGVLRVFPLTLASDGAAWTDLVWAALALMVRIEKKTPADVGVWLPRLVAELE
jgi:hypothetical protein